MTHLATCPGARAAVQALLDDVEHSEQEISAYAAAVKAEAWNPLRGELHVARRVAEQRPEGGSLVLAAAGTLARVNLLRLGAARAVETDSQDGMRFWDFSGERSEGRRCAILPVFRRDRWGNERLLDLLALDPEDESWWALRRGALDRLGESATPETRLYATPLGWLRGAPTVGNLTENVPFDPVTHGRLWLPALDTLELTLLSGCKLACDDEAHAKWLYKALGPEWRRFIEVRVAG